jgi:hypothetical protein
MKRGLLLCAVALLLIAPPVCAIRRLLRGPKLRVGATLVDPVKYFTAEVEVASHHDGRFRQTYCATSLDKRQRMTVNYVTYFFYAPRHAIAVRTFTYGLDTNGNIVKVTSRWKFPALDPE